MKIDPRHDPMRGPRHVLAWAIVPTLLYVLYAALTGSAVPNVSRRPGGLALITWSDTPVQFVVSGLAVYATIAFVMLLVYGLVTLVYNLIIKKH